MARSLSSVVSKQLWQLLCSSVLFAVQQCVT